MVILVVLVAVLATPLVWLLFRLSDPKGPIADKDADKEREPQNILVSGLWPSSNKEPHSS